MSNVVQIRETKPHLGILYHRQPSLTDSLTRLFRMGGRNKKIAEKVQAAFGRIDLGLDPFEGLALTHHGETRIEHCVKFDLGDGFRLVTIQHKKICVFCYVGNHDDCDRWLIANSGYRLSVDRTGHLIPISTSSTDVLIRRQPSYSQRPLMETLTQAQQDELLAGISPSLMGKLFQLDGSATDETVYDLCNEITNEDKRGILYDVLCLLLHGDQQGAVRRLDLAANRIDPIERLSEAQLMEVRDGPELRRIIIGSPEHRAWLKQLALSAPFMEWLLFMHPEQQAIAIEDFSGAAQLSGVSGSGKTCIAVRRAVHLAERTSERVLVLTLNRSLAGMISTMVDHACVDDEVRGRIEVMSFFQLCQTLLADLEPSSKYVDKDEKLNDHVEEVFREYFRCWNNNFDADILWPVHRSLVARGVSGETYVKEEFDWIRTAFEAGSRESYLTAERVGRRYNIPQERRELLLKGLYGWERKMLAVGVTDYLGLTTALTKHLAKIKPRYRHILVDEAQDFGTTELRIVRALAEPAPNDLFLCGDIAQHVLPKHRVLSLAQIDVVGRARTIRRNYRNSREILAAAYNVLLQNLDVSQFDGTDLQILDPEYANRSSPQPIALRAQHLAEEIQYARSLVADYLQTKQSGKCCIAFAGFSLREIELFGEQESVPVLSGARAVHNEGLVFSDLEQTKGYEFNVMVIINCTEGVLPPHDAMPEEHFRHGCRLYVAMTRARDELYLSYSGRASGWLDNAKDSLTFLEWKDVMSIAAGTPGTTPPHLPEVQDEAALKSLNLNGRQFLYTAWALGLSQEAQNKIEELVDGRGLISNGRRIRWQTMGALRNDLELAPYARNLFGPKVSEEIRALLGSLY